MYIIINVLPFFGMILCMFSQYFYQTNIYKTSCCPVVKSDHVTSGAILLFEKGSESAERTQKKMSETYGKLIFSLFLDIKSMAMQFTRYG